MKQNIKENFFAFLPSFFVSQHVASTTFLYFPKKLQNEKL